MQDALTMTEAAKRLGITRVTLGRLVRGGSLPTMENPLDKRQRLIPEWAIRKLEGQTPRPRPRSIGSVADLGIRSDEVEEWLEAMKTSPSCPQVELLPSILS